MKIQNPRQVIYLDNNLIKQFQPNNKGVWLLIDSIYHNMIYEIAGERYIFKNKGPEYSLNELLGEGISKYFGLATVHPEIASFNKRMARDCFGVLIKIFFQNDSTYFYINNFPHVEIPPHHYNLDNLAFLSVYYDEDLDDDIPLSPENSAELKTSLKKMIIRDFFANQQDRSIENFMFQKNNGYVTLAPLYDHEYSFGDYHYCSSFFNLDLNDPKVREIIKMDDDFKSFLTKGLVINIQYFISQVEDEHHIILDKEEKERVIKTLKRQKRKVIACRKDLGL